MSENLQRRKTLRDLMSPAGTGTHVALSNWRKNLKVRSAYGVPGETLVVPVSLRNWRTNFTLGR